MRVLQNVKFQQYTVSVHLAGTNILCEKFILQHPHFCVQGKRLAFIDPYHFFDLNIPLHP